MTLKASRLQETEYIDENIINVKKRHLHLLESKKNKPTDFFYRVSNPGQLTKIGQSYLEDFKNGVKSFAITSTNYKASQQRTILALASFFDHSFDMKILIISDSLQKGVFEELMEVKKTSTISANDSLSLEVNHFYHHFDLVDLGKLMSLGDAQKPSFDFEVAIDKLMKTYDIVFWDTPIINTYKNNSRIYKHILNYFESLTIIVEPAVSKASDVQAIKNYFTSMGVNVKGVLFDAPELGLGQDAAKKAVNLE